MINDSHESWRMVNELQGYSNQPWHPKLSY